MDFMNIVLMADTARQLSEPGEPNAEYVRGQVNLICDLSGIMFATDRIGDALTAYITHESNAEVFFRDVAAGLWRHA